MLGLNTATGQPSASARVYQSRYRELKSKAIDLMERARGCQEKGPALLQEALAITKLVHRLQEEATREANERAPRDKSLLLVSQACEALDFTLLVVDSFIDTHDRSFLQLARQGVSLMDSTEQFF